MKNRHSFWRGMVLLLAALAFFSLNMGSKQADECCCDLWDWDCELEAVQTCCGNPRGTGDVWVTDYFGCCFDWGVCFAALDIICDVTYGSPIVTGIICDCSSPNCY